jgi:hypothetical protein
MSASSAVTRSNRSFSSFFAMELNKSVFEGRILVIETQMKLGLKEETDKALGSEDAKNDARYRRYMRQYSPLI